MRAMILRRGRSVTKDGLSYYTLEQYETRRGSDVRVRIHPRVGRKRPEISDEDVEAAFQSAIRSRARDTDPVQWVGIGTDRDGRLLEFIAVEQHDAWLVFHAMKATKAVLTELGLARERS